MTQRFTLDQVCAVFGSGPRCLDCSKTWQAWLRYSESCGVPPALTAPFSPFLLQPATNDTVSFHSAILQGTCSVAHALHMIQARHWTRVQYDSSMHVCLLEVWKVTARSAWSAYTSWMHVRSKSLLCEHQQSFAMQVTLLKNIQDFLSVHPIRWYWKTWWEINDKVNGMVEHVDRAVRNKTNASGSMWMQNHARQHESCQSKATNLLLS